MLKKVLSSAIVLLSIFAFSGFVWASVEGSWNVQGNATVKVSIKGYKSETVREAFEDEFTFYNNGYFEMIDIDGIWSQNKKKFTVTLDPADVADYFSYMLSEELESDVYVEVTKMSLTGTEQKNGTIKGKMKFNMTFYIEDYDLSGKIITTTNFTGIRLVNILSNKGTEHNQMPISAFDIIKEQFDRMVMP